MSSREHTKGYSHLGSTQGPRLVPDLNVLQEKLELLTEAASAAKDVTAKLRAQEADLEKELKECRDALLAAANADPTEREKLQEQECDAANAEWRKTLNIRDMATDALKDVAAVKPRSILAWATSTEEQLLDSQQTSGWFICEHYGLNSGHFLTKAGAYPNDISLNVMRRMAMIARARLWALVQTDFEQAMQIYAKHGMDNVGDICVELNIDEACREIAKGLATPPSSS